MYAIAHDQSVDETQAVADGMKRTLLTTFRALTVADVQGGGVIVARGESSADTGIHPSTKQDDSALAMGGHDRCIAFGMSLQTRNAASDLVNHSF